jgi:hypothetical protein
MPHASAQHQHQQVKHHQSPAAITASLNDCRIIAVASEPAAQPADDALHQRLLLLLAYPLLLLLLLLLFSFKETARRRHSTCKQPLLLQHELIRVYQLRPTLPTAAAAAAAAAAVCRIGKEAASKASQAV